MGFDLQSVKSTRYQNIYSITNILINWCLKICTQIHLEAFNIRRIPTLLRAALADRKSKESISTVLFLRLFRMKYSLLILDFLRNCSIIVKSPYQKGLNSTIYYSECEPDHNCYQLNNMPLHHLIYFDFKYWSINL